MGGDGGVTLGALALVLSRWMRRMAEYHSTEGEKGVFFSREFGNNQGRCVSLSPKNRKNEKVYAGRQGERRVIRNEGAPGILFRFARSPLPAALGRYVCFAAGGIRARRVIEVYYLVSSHPKGRTLPPLTATFRVFLTLQTRVYNIDV